MVYSSIREVLRAHLEKVCLLLSQDLVRVYWLTYAMKVLKDVCVVVENCQRKTVTTSDVVFALHRQGRTLYVRTRLGRSSEPLP